MAKKKARRNVSGKNPRVRSQESRGISMGLAIIALILNVFFVPGLGTLIAGKSRTGIWQVALLLTGAIFFSIAYIYEMSIFYVGSLLMITAWIWGLIIGVQLIQEAR